MNINTNLDWDVHKKQSLYPMEECCKQIEFVIENTIINLYDSIDNFIYQDIDYNQVLANIPQWVTSAGIYPELNCTKEWYEKLRRKETHPIFGRTIYYYDLWSKVSAVQDRLSAVIMFMRKFYSIVPCKAQYTESQYTSGSRCSGIRETEAHILLNSIFVAYASAFDIIAKIAVEQFEFDKYDFSKYKQMNSSKTLYKKNLRNIDSSLKSAGMLFTESLVIRQIQTFRNEFVHNGPWDINCSIYYTAINGEPADVIIYSPDMDEKGNFISSGSRNKFYSQANRINFQLPNIIKEATKVLKNTINQLSRLYQKNTTNKSNQEYTIDCCKAILNYYESLRSIIP